MTVLQAYVFSDGNTAGAGAGHQIDLGSGLTANQTDTLGVVCDAIVDTPAGWSAAPDDVSVAAMYIFRRTTGASGLVTIHTSADRPCSIIHVRLAQVLQVDDAAKNVVSGSAGTSSPTVTSAVLASAGEAAVTFALLHNFAANPTGPSWTGGFSALDTTLGPFAVSTDGTANHSTAITAAVNLNAGTAPVSTAASWTTAAAERGAMLLSWEALTPGGVTVVDYGAPPVDGVLAATLPALTSALTGDARSDGDLAAVLPALLAFLTDQVDQTPGVLAAGGTSTTLTAAGTAASALTAAGTATSLTASGTP